MRTQRGVEIELIVVDDASTDDTWSWLSTQSDLQALRQSANSGAGAARNAGLAVATGFYVMFLDDDDLLVAGALLRLASALQANSTAVAAAGARYDWFVDEGWGRRDTHPRFTRVRHTFDAFLFGWSAVPSQSMFRSEVVRALGGFDLSVPIVDDRDLWLRVSRMGPTVLVADVVVRYRITRNQYRPSDIVMRRNRVADKAIAALPDDQRERATRLRQSALLMNAAEENARARQFANAIGNLARAFAAFPQIYGTPFIAAWVIQRLGRASVRAFIPPRLLSSR